MKIVMLVPDLALIGAQKMGLNFLSTLDKELSIQSELIVLSDKINDLNKLQVVPSYIALKNFHSGYLSKIDTILSIYKLRKEISRISPDVVISIAPIMNIYLLIALSFFNTKIKPKIIIEEHQYLSQSLQYDANSHHWTMKIFYKYFLNLYKNADVLKVVSNDSKLDFINHWGLENKKISVLNPPINIEDINVLSAENIPLIVKNFINDGDKIIFSLGRLESQKNFSLLIDSFFNAYKKDATLKLIIAGGGSELNMLQHQIEHLGMKSNILLTGFIRNPYPIFKIAKLFCLTSIWEGMPVTIMESMSQGCPVISVDCKSGPAEMIVDGENGLLVESDIDSISNAIILVINNQNLLTRMSLNCVILAKQWDVKSYSKDFLDLICQPSKD
jgi:glycosyltransferase involved in cell wall biosynthesis